MSRRPTAFNQFMFFLVAVIIGMAIVLIPMWLTGHLT